MEEWYSGRHAVAILFGFIDVNYAAIPLLRTFSAA